MVTDASFHTYIFGALSSKSDCTSLKKSKRARSCCQSSARPCTLAGVTVSAESANCRSLCAGSGSVAVQQNGPGASGGRLEGQPRAHHVLLQEGAVQFRGVRLPDQDRGVHPQSEKTCLVFVFPPDLINHLRAIVFVTGKTMNSNELIL